MTEKDYLDPDAVKMQCDAAIFRLEKDNEALVCVESSLDAFINDKEIKSVAYDALKLQLSDYKTLLRAMRDANSSDISDYFVLKTSVGDALLDGANIFEQIRVALEEKTADEDRALECERNASESEEPWIAWYYNCKAGHYWRMVEVDQELCDAWQAKADSYDEIETKTKNLFQGSTMLRQAAQRGLESITGAFQNGGYVSDAGAEWRQFFTDDYKKEWYTEELKKLGYTQGEIDYLISKGIVLTCADIGKIKETLITEKIFVSNDNKALLYNGKVYSIYIPEDKGVAFEAVWTLDAQRQVGKTEFNWAAGILGIELEDIPKDEISTRDLSHKVQSSTPSPKHKNTAGAAAFHVIMGLGSFVLSSLNHTEVTIYFESSGNGRRVSIAVGDFETRQKFQNMNYNVPINTYMGSKEFQSKQFASTYAAGVYMLASGESVPDPDGAYTLTGKLDERHKDSVISGFLSYSEEGELIYTPLVFSGDEAYVAKCDKYTGRNPEVILDFTDKLKDSTLTDETARKIFEQALEDE